MFKIIKIPQGEITVSYSDEHLSTGCLRLKPYEVLEKHSRPVKEQLVQISGACKIILLTNDILSKEVEVRVGDTLEIPANQFHIHDNFFGNTVSITMWKFEGDIRPILENLGQKTKTKV